MLGIFILNFGVGDLFSMIMAFIHVFDFCREGFGIALYGLCCSILLPNSFRYPVVAATTATIMTEMMMMMMMMMIMRMSSGNVMSETGNGILEWFMEMQQRNMC